MKTVQKSSSAPAEEHVVARMKAYLRSMEGNLRGVTDIEVGLLPVSGSSRRYARVSSPEMKRSCIACLSDDVSENHVFVSLTRALGEAGVAVPSIAGVSSDGCFYIQSDLGSESLFDRIEREAPGPDGIRHPGGDVEARVAEAMRDLAFIHTLPPAAWEEHVGFAPFGHELTEGDFRYFLDRFLEPSGVTYDAAALRKDFDRLGQRLCGVGSGSSGFMYRDFQSRNVMVCEGEGGGVRNYYIDYQSGRRGPGLYDVASFLWQAKARFAPDFRSRMAREYAGVFSTIRGCDADAVLEPLGDFVLFRTLQVLGAYGFRGLIEGKRHFVESIPPAVGNLSQLVADGVCSRYPELRRISARLAERYEDKSAL